MAIERIIDLPYDNSPTGDDYVPIDNSSPNQTRRTRVDDLLASAGAGIFATAAQGATADTALQPSDIGVSVASAAQGILADTAMQPAVYDPQGRGSDAFGWQGMKISATDAMFGATTSGTQTPAQRVLAIQAAIDWAAPLGVAVYIPAGVWLTDGVLKWRNNSIIDGAGIDAAIIRFATTAAEDLNMMQPAAFDMSIGRVRVSNLTLDGNRTARVAAGTVTGVGTQRPGSSGLSSMSAHDCVFYRVKSIGHVLHCFDDCAGGDLDGGNRKYCWPEGPTTYSTTPSKNNIYIECEASDWADDGFTSHFTRDVTFLRCRSVGGSNYYTSNLDGSCCIEFDDGTLGGKALYCYVEGSARGIIAKNHDGVPCASKIEIIGNEVVGCGAGITAAGYDATDPGTDCKIIGNTVRNPVQLPGRTVDMHGIRISDYYNVQCLDNRIVAPASTVGLASGIYCVSNCTQVIIDGNIIQHWPGVLNTADNTKAGIRVATSALPIIGTNFITSPGAFGISWSGSNVGPRNVGLTMITGTGMANSVGLYTSGAWGTVLASVSGFTYTIQDSVSQSTGIIQTIQGMLRTGGINIGPAVSKTMVSGSITIDGPGAYSIDTEGAAATGNLTDIVGGRTGDLISLKSATSSRDPTLKDATGTGTSLMQINGDFTLLTSSDSIVLLHNGSNWIEWSRSKNI